MNGESPLHPPARQNVMLGYNVASAHIEASSKALFWSKVQVCGGYKRGCRLGWGVRGGLDTDQTKSQSAGL